MESYKRAPSSTSLLKSRVSGILEVHPMTPLEQEEELKEAMKTPLAAVSRQRLRAMQINFRRCGSVDNCISSRELMNVFNEHNLGIPNRTFQMLISQFNEGTGINHERLWKFLVEAQSKTGRDSVQAIHKTHNHYMGHRFNEELSSADRALLEKVHKALMSSKEYDLIELRTSCEDKDPSRNGQIPKKKFKRIVEEQHLPLSGALLNNLLKKCDEEGNGMVNWFEFMVLMEKAEHLSIAHTKTPEPTNQTNQVLKSNAPKKAANNSGPPGKKLNEKTTGPVKTKGKQTNNNTGIKKPIIEEKEKATASEQSGKGRSSVLSNESGKESGRKVTFRTGDTSPSSSCNSSRRGSLSSVAGESDLLKGAAQQSPRIGSAKSKASRPGSSTPGQSRPGSVGPGQTRPGSSTNGQSRPGSSTPGQSRTNPGEDQSPRPGSRNTPNSSRRASLTSQASLLEIIEKVGQSKATKLPSLSASLPQLSRYSEDEDRLNFSTLSLKTLSEVDITQRANQLPGLTMPLHQLLVKKATSDVPPLKNGDLKTISEINSDVAKVDLMAEDDKIADSGVDEPMSSEKTDETRTPGMETEPGLETIIESDQQPSPVEHLDILAKSSDIADKSKTDKSKPVKKVESSKTVVKKPPKLTRPTPSTTAKSGKAKGTKDDKGGKRAKKPPPLVKRTVKQKDPKLPHSMSMQNMSSISEVTTERDMPHSESSPNLIGVIPSNELEDETDLSESPLNQSLSSQNSIATATQAQKDTVESPLNQSISSENVVVMTTQGQKEQKALSRIESSHSLNSISSHSSAGSHGSKVKIPQEPVKMEVVVREQPMTVHVPDTFADKKLKFDEPKENLTLNWIYGYRGNDCRNNLHRISSGEIVYFISYIAIIYNHKQQKQRYYKDHTGDIRSMAVHEDQVTIATGQSDLDGTKKQVKTCIRIWNSTNLKTLHVIEDDGFQQAIICLSFSQNLLAAVDNYESHTLSLWDAKTYKKVSETKCNTDIVCQIGFHPKKTTCIVSIGKDHLVFWDLKGSAIEQTMEADYGENEKPKFIICMLFRANGDIVTGDSNGTIMIWLSGQNTPSQVIRKAHQCPIFALIEHKKSLLSGGRDGSIYAWDVKDSKCYKSSELLIPASAGGIRTILVDDLFTYVGTTLNCILRSELQDTGPLLSGAIIEKNLITQGHYDEVHGLRVYPAQTAVAPSLQQHAQGVFLTCGYDGMVCCYDSNTHQALWKHWVKDCNIQCVDIHPNGTILVMGGKSADLCFFSINLEGSLFELNRSKVSKSMITTVKFSPDGQTLAAGCYDGRITTVRLIDDGRRTEIVGKCNIHQSSITGLDWSKDKCYNEDYILQSSSSTFEYFNFTPSCELINNLVETRNAEWMTNNCMVGYHTNGIWGGEMASTEFTTVDRSHDQNLLAAGDEDGDIKLYTHPCSNQEAKFKNFHGHAFGVKSVVFGETDKFLISIGNRDCAIIQWNLIK
ncbi:uncharacterized protein [Antedon mediterranea]|uniref:uncharacterized protein isoform X2 n=1 Tax=Antedon mediterranea TaxID=105859 RepID=UPI003AF62624